MEESGASNTPLGADPMTESIHSPSRTPLTGPVSLPDGSELVLRVMPLPADVNGNGDIFGGWLMAQMDLAGAVLPSRIARGRIATVAVNEFIFKQPVSVGDLVSFYARVVRNIFEECVERQANRIVSIAPITTEILRTLTEADIPEMQEAIDMALVFGDAEQRRAEKEQAQPAVNPADMLKMMGNFMPPANTTEQPTEQTIEKETPPTEKPETEQAIEKETPPTEKPETEQAKEEETPPTEKPETEDPI